ncbi:MAG: hypothetical protein KA956_09365 [Pyrinomonadaceae bacterium]|nr:hypothetical protein [Acidobacteriota bacterium]MBK7932345.1 hypothetical protein [Acidobacteriota bacterium]MBP7376676.1 hypothetical protein [Pyrinomonadaceae bacterium]
MSRVITRNDLSYTKRSRRSRNRLSLYMLAFIAYWYAPVIYGFWLWQNLKMGAFAADTDSTAIPLMAFVFLWFVGFPFFLLATIGFETLMRKRDRRASSHVSVRSRVWEQSRPAGVK